jgi:hypothetical protein
VPQDILCHYHDVHHRVTITGNEKTRGSWLKQHWSIAWHAHKLANDENKQVHGNRALEGGVSEL